MSNTFISEEEKFGHPHISKHFRFENSSVVIVPKSPAYEYSEAVLNSMAADAGLGIGIQGWELEFLDDA